MSPTYASSPSSDSAPPSSAATAPPNSHPAPWTPASAAVSAGTLHGLDAAAFEDALGMAATQSCGLMSAQFESMVKRMQHGFAARNGLTAA
ncbi:MmgE/PrpD family protein, partial [Streptomyces sp. NPDC088246]|uniref:MmgE/PrpD family protein n=1 Tax=Streptomyces sp. NPDC088246 TaxID=3365842 RepID=UPI00381C7F1F